MKAVSWMADEPDNPIFRHLRAIREQLDTMSDRILAPTRRVGNMAVRIADLSVRTDRIDTRLDRVERRLGLIDA